MHAAADRVRDGVGLLGDLLRHEGRPSALLGGRGIPHHFEGRGLDGAAVEVADLDAVGGDRDDLVLPDREGVAGVLDEGRDVGAEEVLAVAEADHERRVAAGADDEAGLVLVHREERERAFEAAHDRAERRDEIAGCPVLVPEEHRRDLGVGLGAEGVSEGEQVGLQLGEVLDDAVVDDRELVVIREVRVRVRVGGSAVRGPAGVADAGRAVGHGVGGEVVAEDLQLAGALPHVEGAALVDDRDAGGVVAAVFEPGEPREEDGLAVPRADVSDDSTHAL